MAILSLSSEKHASLNKLKDQVFLYGLRRNPHLLIAFIYKLKLSVHFIHLFLFIIDTVCSLFPTGDHYRQTCEGIPLYHR